MTDPLFPFEIRLHRDAFSVHKVHHVSLTDPVLTDPEKVKAWHVWRQFDSLSAPTKYKDWQRNSDNTDWLFLNAWHLEQEYADGQVPVADADGYLMPGDAGGGESGGPIDGSGTGGMIAKWADSNTLEDSSLDENTDDITSTKPLILPASTTSIASLRAPHGSAPSSPVDGDVWTTSAGLFVRVNGVTVGPLGGGGGGWTQVVDEDGTSFANFTSIAGTWASNGTEITQTDTSASSKHARLTAELLTAYCVFEADVRIDSSGAGAISRVGLVAGYNGTIGASTIVYLEGNATTGLEVTSDSEASAELGTTSFSFNYDTFYTLRLVIAGNRVTAFVDGTQRLSVANTGGPLNTRYLALLSYGSAGRFQNIKMWRPVLPGE